MIAIACDHAAYLIKNRVAAHLTAKGLKVKDFGCDSENQVDYPDYALKCAEAVSSGEAKSGILICGTGIGMSIAANKVKGVRCAHCCDEFSAEMTRKHNDANMIALGARLLSEDAIIKLIDIFLDTPYPNEERHSRRVNKITEIENKYFK